MKTTEANETCNGTACDCVTDYAIPEVNISETAEGYTLEAELPGVAQEGSEITVDGNEITIIGRRATEAVPGDVLLRELTNTDYRRTFELDPAIDTSRIAAKLEQGMLTLTLPKSEKVKPRKIEVAS